MANFIRVALLAALVFLTVIAVANDDEFARVTPGSRGSQLTVALDLDPVRGIEHETLSRVPAALDPIRDLREALGVCQNSWYQIWIGKWPTSIDWTGAVLNTHLVASIGTLSKALAEADDAHIKNLENEINTFFAQIAAYYFGEDAFAIRNQAYDDMLWVVLGWLESVKFINLHSSLHYIQVQEKSTAWHGVQFIEAFAHRARVFYDIAKHGWDTRLCGGGLTWNPYLSPYKNAITNELYISASIAMYLYSPGDSNTAPFATESGKVAYPHDPQYLKAAIDGYDWLKDSDMTNAKGLYTDGFHVTNWTRNGTVCDERNEMVFTYNQGVVLSGLRGLWEATGNRTYLEDGHALIRNVITATGWLLENAGISHNQKKWRGLGRGGILEEVCDAEGKCDQDGHSFKGIYFHHLTLFCETLPMEPLLPGKTHVADKELALLHRQNCQEYALWVAHNAQAALATRDKNGKFGSWWGAGLDIDQATPVPEGAIDYRNDASELKKALWVPQAGGILPTAQSLFDMPSRVESVTEEFSAADADETQRSSSKQSLSQLDLNDRGRGRTVESHSGGIAVLRCLWELMHQAD